MTRLQQLERDAKSLTDEERAEFAARLLASLPAVLSDADDGISEALRRDAEMEASGDPCISWDELRRGLGR